MIKQGLSLLKIEESVFPYPLKNLKPVSNHMVYRSIYECQQSMSDLIFLKMTDVKKSRAQQGLVSDLQLFHCLHDYRYMIN